MFCSPIGPNYPDPNKKVCKLVDDFEKESFTEQEFEADFLKTVEEDSAIIPISHLGIQLYVGTNVDLTSLSPSLNVIRFDQLKLE